MKFVIATHNQHKLKEFQRILAPMNIDICTADLHEVEETGTTFAENAFLKAESACKESGIPAVADDSGLMVDALNGRPGVFSARYAGENATDYDRIQKLLTELKDVPKLKRTAKFVSSICCVFPNGKVIRAEGICKGIITDIPIGEDGFGYDPVFQVGEKTFAQMSPQEKDAVSHRGKALRKFEQEIQTFLNKKTTF